jgi:pantoate kinase
MVRRGPVGDVVTAQRGGHEVREKVGVPANAGQPSAASLPA